MKYRKLRIAWSVVWGIAISVLIGLWIDSYWNSTIILRVSSERRTSIENGLGRMSLSSTSLPPAVREVSWTSIRAPMTSIVLDANKAAEAVMHHFAGVHWMFLKKTWRIAASHWLLALAMAAIAAAPWLPWFRSHFRLRTLLIATTLVAVVLGLVVWIARAR
jgi:hypothetical protein